MMQYKRIDREADHIAVILTGELVRANEADRLRDDLEPLYADKGVKEIRIDLSRLMFVSLEGVGALLDLWRAATAGGKRFLALGSRGQVREKLSVTGVLRPLESGGKGPSRLADQATG